MKHYFRLIRIFIRSWLMPKVKFTDTTEVSFRVWPTDIDLLFHMNNGVYLSLMDLGRMDLTLRSGFYAILTKNGIYPVLGSEIIRFRRSLKPFQKFTMRTQLWDWDEKYFYLRQRFIVKDTLYASAIVKARFLDKKNSGVSPQKIFELLEISPSESRKQLAADSLDLKFYKDAESLLDSSPS